MPWLALLRNALDYPLRQFFRWRRTGLVTLNEPKEPLLAALPCEAQARAAQLFRTYPLNSFYTCSQAKNYLINLYYLDLLETAFSRCSPSLLPAIHAVDIGPSHWFYVQALYAFLRSYGTKTPGRPVCLEAYEADPYRVYRDLYSRLDHAICNIRQLPGISYHPTAFTAIPGAFDLVFQFFPFIFIREHLDWGLPSNMFQPQELLQAALLSLKPAGYLLIVNQGPAEHESQLALLAGQSITPLTSFKHSSLLYQYRHDHYVTLCQLS